MVEVAVRAILKNPRYTGRQVWNRQRRDEVLLDVEDVAAGHETKMRWNDHPTGSGRPNSPRTARLLGAFRLRLRCRWRQATHRPTPWQRPHDEADYALLGPRLLLGSAAAGCRALSTHGTRPLPLPLSRPSTPRANRDRSPEDRLRPEDASCPQLDGWIATLFNPENLDATCEATARPAASTRGRGPRSRPPDASWPTATSGSQATARRSRLALTPSCRRAGWPRSRVSA